MLCDEEKGDDDRDEGKDGRHDESDMVEGDYREERHFAIGALIL
jgi:hypothetical protein